jgi:hypothetical protein
MAFVPGTSGNTIAAFPTRDFTFILDPPLVEALVKFPHRGVAALIRDLRTLPNGVRITLLYPSYLAQFPERGTPSYLADCISIVSSADGVPPFNLSSTVGPKTRRALNDRAVEATRARGLLALAEVRQADGVVSSLPVLVDSRHALYQHHRIRVIPLSELGAVLEVCAHGHGIFWSATEYTRNLSLDLYYQWLHPKGRRLAQWYDRISGRLQPSEHQENVRSAVLNRYPFVLYSRDMVRFYELQLDHFTRRGLYRRFSSALGYHITNFYLHLWGLMEQLTVLAKYQHALALEDAECGIHKNKTFWKVLGPKEPGLRSFIKSPTIAPWIAAMADVRHAAAHRAMLLPTAMVQETPESQVSDDEVRARLREEDPDFYAIMPPDVVAALEPMRIWHWRVDHYKTVSENEVIVKGRSGTYIRGAVISIDYDL